MSERSELLHVPLPSTIALKQCVLIPALERFISRMACTYTIDVQAKINNDNK